MTLSRDAIVGSGIDLRRAATAAAGNTKSVTKKKKRKRPLSLFTKTKISSTSDCNTRDSLEDRYIEALSHAYCDSPDVSELSGTSALDSLESGQEDMAAKSTTCSEPVSKSNRCSLHKGIEKHALHSLLFPDTASNDTHSCSTLTSDDSGDDSSTASNETCSCASIGRSDDDDDNDSSTKKKDWGLTMEQYVSKVYGYKGFETGPPPGPKKYKSGDELLVPPRAELLGEGDRKAKLYRLFRLVTTFITGVSILAGVLVAYSLGYTLLTDGNDRFGIGLYGVFLFTFMCVQVTFASLEHRRARSPSGIPPEDYGETAPSTIGLQVSVYQEDPDYLRGCFEGIMKLNYPRDKLKVLVCIDGNSEDSMYMPPIFEEVVTAAGETPVFFRWDYNLHELPEGLEDSENGLETLRECIDKHKFICIMQKWGGKREVM